MSSSQAGSNSETMTLFESVTASNPQLTPGRVPQTEYERMNQDERNNLNRTYGDRKWRAELHNRNSFLWFWGVYSGKCGDQGQNDPLKRHALEVKMSQFKVAIQKNSKPYPALALDFSKYPFRNPKQNEVAWDE